MKKTAELKLTATFDRDLVWERGGSVRYLVVTLEGRKPEKEKIEERKPLNIALVIDASGSMSGGKLEAAKDAARGLISRMNEGDRISLVSFADDVITHVDAVSVTPEAIREIDNELMRLQTRGCTNLSEGWFTGVDCAGRVAERDPEMRARVIILSDGHANRGISNAMELAEHAGQLRTRGVITSTLGIGDGYDEQLLQGIAEHGGGRMHDAELADEISSVLLGELGEVLEAAAEETILRIDAPSGVRVEAFGLAQPSRSLDGLSMMIGALSDGIARDIVLKVTCPAGEPGSDLNFPLFAEGTCAETGRGLRTDPATIGLSFATAVQNDRQQPEEGIVRHVASAWHAHILRQSSRLNRDAAREEAERFVTEELRFFERYVGGHGFARQMVREIRMIRDRIGHRWSERTRKEMSLHAVQSVARRADFRGSAKMSFAEHLKREDRPRR
ncbi:secreted protein with Ig-like and vWFA domain [Aliiruegeria haliotis]|uniref:Secreted protein with Ig-like and vWFA domain n=1 Tax=Aliiruegeria haliotis TaxID=1280846 RepID=A0A2T0RJC6_9RHOB|nr:VWA domain-containing protein [Aliiruegeria haliotis]PRY21279.1 secreted protein with Ig-like and vWFA domain [Aliiruegeria haliotis]